MSGTGNRDAWHINGTTGQGCLAQGTGINGAGINGTGDRDSRTRRLRGHTGQLGGSAGRSRDGQRGWKSPSLAWGLTGTSRGVPASGAGDTQCSPTQVRLQLLQRELRVRAGHGRGSAGAERAPPFPPSGGAEEDEEEEEEGGEGSSEMARRRTALRSQSELERSGCAPRVRPLAARGGRGRGSPSRCGPDKQLRKGRRPGTPGGTRRAARAQATTVTATRARGACGAPEPQGTPGGLREGTPGQRCHPGDTESAGGCRGCGDGEGRGRGTGRDRQGGQARGVGQDGQCQARVGSARQGGQPGWAVPGRVVRAVSARQGGQCQAGWAVPGRVGSHGRVPTGIPQGSGPGKGQAEEFPGIPQSHSGAMAPGRAPPAMRHSTVRHAGTRHSRVRHSAVRHSRRRHSAVRHSRVRHSRMRHSTVRHSAVRHSGTRHSAVRHAGTRHSTVRHSTVRHSTVRHSAVRHSRRDAEGPGAPRDARSGSGQHREVAEGHGDRGDRERRGQGRGTGGWHGIV
ncbi:collagen alpha-1(XXII) chain-like isoform X4 [Melospiza georgiana]|uniref:collagen alpha-1(XXII) chain-like isoform X4 n=1 Tax=Melospiza georgiana TaxID=44398 RepID=UPI0025AB9C4E|nr:collagen alpha-1(XXII) chain-like isoform X4 [Melospiza georgiana]